MKKVTVVGLGTGLNTLTREAEKAIHDAQYIIGAKTVLSLASSLWEGTGKPVFESFSPSEILMAINHKPYESYIILVSGDVGFYSASAKLAEALSAYDLRFIPGVSTVNAFFARLGIPWQDACFVSLHGQVVDIVSCVRRNKYTFCLTGNNVNHIAGTLESAGFSDIKAYVGQNIGMDTEKVYSTTVSGLMHGDFPSLTVLLFENEGFDRRAPIGIPDSKFTRFNSIPMTKSEVRALCLSKLNLNPTDICYDIGAGTGSVTVEMALNAYLGHVYAVERKTEAINLIEENLKAFHLGNVTVLNSVAPDGLRDLPVPDAVFIGGSGGKIEEIIAAVFDKNPHARVVVTAITIETEIEVLDALKSIGKAFDMIRLNISRRKPLGSGFMMEALNPVTIISAGGTL
jgi:precorrin-6Y C5,15-methyltransferase (decarboxylating)